MYLHKIQTSKLQSGVLLLGTVFLLLSPQDSFGVPYFARKLNVTCTTCHVIPPKLNQTGENFAANGYTLPQFEPAHTTWPFALWVTYRGETQTSQDIHKAFPNKVELISGGPIGNTALSYFLEWRILSLQTQSDGSLKDRSGRFEDLFVTYSVANTLSLSVGQYRLLRQIDDSQKLGLSTPVVIGAGIAGRPAGSSRKTSLRKFSPNGRSPTLSVQVRTLQGVNPADGWFHILSLPFPGELSAPLTAEARDEASFEFESDPKGVFFESYYKRGLSSIGAHLFVDDGRSLGSVVGRYHRGPWVSMVGVGFGHVGEKTDGRFTWESEYIPRDYFSIKARIDHQTDVSHGTAFIPSVILRWPGTQWTMLFVVEQRIRTDNHATFTELSLLF